MFPIRSLFSIKRYTRDPRLARMLHGGVSGLLGRGLALLVSAVSLPLTVRYLGKLEYGVWITISSSVVMLSVLDLGIANTLTNLISEAFAEQEPVRSQQAARRAFSTALGLTVAISLMLAGVAGVLWHLLDWGRLLQIHDPELVRQARLAVAISIGYFLLSLPLNLANRVLSGYQEVHTTNYFAMISSLLGLGSILWIIAIRGSLVQLMLAFCVSMLMGLFLLNAWLLMHSKPWLRPHHREMSREVARSLFRQGALFFVLQLTGLVVFNSDNLVITHYLGPAEVTPYSVAWRLTSYASLLQSLLIPSFWPAFTEAYTRREMDWVRSTYRSMNRKSLTAVLAAAVLIGVVGRPLIRVWAGRDAAPPLLLLWTMAVWAVVVSVTTNQALLLTATNRLKLEAAVAVTAAVANLALSIVLVQRIGAEGVILSTLLSFLVIMVVPQQLEVRRILRGDYLPALAVGHDVLVPSTEVR